MRLKVPALVMVSLFRSKQGHRYAAAGAVAAGESKYFFTKFLRLWQIVQL